MSLEEALAQIFRGQTNVAQAANKLDMSLDTLKEKLRDYVKAHPIDPDAWLHDQPFDR